MYFDDKDKIKFFQAQTKLRLYQMLILNTVNLIR